MFPLRIIAIECSIIEVAVIITYTYICQREARSEKAL